MRNPLHEASSCLATRLVWNSNLWFVGYSVLSTTTSRNLLDIKNEVGYSAVNTAWLVWTEAKTAKCMLFLGAPYLELLVKFFLPLFSLFWDGIADYRK